MQRHQDRNVRELQDEGLDIFPGKRELFLERREMGGEKFLPQVNVSVLLVESDDATRQIITALLRKCNYRGKR